MGDVDEDIGLDENQRGYLEALLFTSHVERQPHLTDKQKRRLVTWDRRSLVIIRRAVKFLDS